MFTIACCQYPDVQLLINRLNQFFRFDHHIFLMDSAIDLIHWFPTPSSKLNYLPPQTICTFNDFPDIAKHAALTSITSKNTFLIVVVESLNLVNSSKLLTQIKAVRKRFVDVNANVKIGAFFLYNVTSLDIVEELFRSSWSAGIVNILSAFYLNVDDGRPSFNVFKYNPFGKFELINVTRNTSPGDYFPDKVPNYRKDPLRFGWNEEFPLRAIQVKFWDTVVSVVNASMSKIQVPKTWLEMDILYQQMTIDRGRLEGVYPHHQIIITMLVPHAQPHSGLVAYLQNGTWTLLFVGAFGVIAMSSLLLIFSDYLHEKKILLCRCVADVVNLLINDNAGIKYQNLHRAHVFIIIPLTFTGLIVMNGIFSLFQSFITSPIYQRQINSIHDLYMSSALIVSDERMTQSVEKDLEDLSKYSGWEGKVHGINHRQLEHDIWMFNNSIAFFAFDNEANVLLDLQKRLGLKAYHMLNDIFLGKYLIGFIVHPEFPFTEFINGIVHRLNDAGLIDKWLKEHSENFMEIYWQFSRHRQIINKAEVDEFVVPTVVWGGWIASTIVFVCEIVWSQVKSIKSKILKRNFRFRFRRNVQKTKKCNKLNEKKMALGQKCGTK